MATTATPPLKKIEPRPEFAGILRDEQTFATGDAKASGESINRWFDSLLLQSGLGLQPAVLIMLSLLSALTLGGIVFVIQENLIASALFGSLGFLIPIGVVVVIRGRRQSKIMNQMPPMIEELARAARTGRSLEQCLEMVADDTQAPLGSELKLAVGRLKMGMAMPAALKDLPDRTGVISMSVFKTALSVHYMTGGDLVAVLERLARTIRDRIAFLGRLRAATIASRATAVLMVSLPPLILIFFVVRDPQYFTKLLDSTWGRRATTVAAVLQIIGVFWVLRILKVSQRS